MVYEAPGQGVRVATSWPSRWWGEKLWTLVPAVAIADQFLATFKDYPQRQTAASFNMDEVLQKLKESDGS